MMLVVLALALIAAACSSESPQQPEQSSKPKGVKGGTLILANVHDVDSLDPGVGYTAAAWALMRLYARTLYSWDSSQSGEALGKPVPDLATAPPTVSPDKRSYTFRIRPGVRWAGPVNTEVTADDFIFAIERQVRGERGTRGPRSPVNPYVFLIDGVREFQAGHADRISGMQAVDDHTLRITLDQPAPDFLSIVSLPFFAPVPRKYVTEEGFVPGDASTKNSYARQVVGSGPYTLSSYADDQRITFERNKNWDVATDPLRKAWVDKVDVLISPGDDDDPKKVQERIQEMIEQGDADLNGDVVPPPASELTRITTDPELRDQYGVRTTACIRYLTLQTDDGPTAKLEVRQALNYAVDKQALIQAIGGNFAGTPATSVLTPPISGYTKYDKYASPDFAGDTDKAKELLRQAGYTEENGYTEATPLRINYVGESTGQGPLVTESLRKSFERVGIELNVKEYKGTARYRESLQIGTPPKRSEHQIGYARSCPDWPGDGARSFIAALLDGRSIQETNNNNFGNYDNPAVNKLIDQALAEADEVRRAALWGRADQLIMDDAAWVPLVYESQTFFWSSRVKNWRFSPWVTNPDYANLWLDPYTP
jgi:ABC-type transport system substrate-binding protein